MSLGTIARQRALRTLPLWALATGVSTSVLLGMLFWRAATRESSISTVTLTLVGWVGVATYLAFADVRTRCTPFEMSLPASSRRLWLASLVATLTGGMLVVGATLGVVALHAALPLRVEIQAETARLAAALGAGVLLAILLIQLPHPKLSRIPVTTTQLLWTFFVLVGTPIVLARAASAGWPGLVLLLFGAAGLILWSYRSIPPAYALEPREPQRAEQITGATDESAPGPSHWVLPWTIVRGVSAGPKELLSVPFIGLFSMVVGGALLSFGDGDLYSLRFLYLPMTAYMMYALTGPRLFWLHHLDFLPIPRRWLVVALVLPYLLVMCIGYGIGALLASEPRSRLEYVDFQRAQQEEGYRVTVPLRVYALSRHGQPPPVTSSWGESHESDTLGPVGRAVLYSPYSAPAGSSARFVAFQISRAVEAVYGAAIPPGTIEQRYLVAREDGSVVPRGDGLTLRHDYPDLEPASGPMFPTLFALSVVPWLLLVALLLRGYRAGIPEWARQLTVWGALALLLLFVVGASLADMLDVLPGWTMRALVEIPVMRLGQSWIGTSATWLAATALVATAFRIVQAQFERMEIPTKPSRYTLIDWPRAESR